MAAELSEHLPVETVMTARLCHVTLTNVYSMSTDREECEFVIDPAGQERRATLGVSQGALNPLALGPLCDLYQPQPNRPHRKQPAGSKPSNACNIVNGHL